MQQAVEPVAAPVELLLQDDHPAAHGLRPLPGGIQGGASGGLLGAEGGGEAGGKRLGEGVHAAGEIGGVGLGEGNCWRPVPVNS